MPDVSVDAHVIDALMRDLAGHDRSPAAFLVYLWLWRRTGGPDGPAAGASLQTVAHATGLSKSAVQAAVRRLKARELIAVERAGATLAPSYRVRAPWR
jgi:DNA-binding MarR family transcriptional regulator